MSKVHLGLTGARFAACGLSGRQGQSKGIVQGISAKSFKATNPEIRCKHCESVFLTKRNAIRRKKGLEPVQHMDDKE